MFQLLTWTKSLPKYGWFVLVSVNLQDASSKLTLVLLCLLVELHLSLK